MGKMSAFAFRALVFIFWIIIEKAKDKLSPMEQTWIVVAPQVIEEQTRFLLIALQCAWRARTQPVLHYL